MKLNALNLSNYTTSANQNCVTNFGYIFREAVNSLKICSWHKPKETKWKINTDASLELSTASLGGFIRDNDGMVVGLFSVEAPAEEIFLRELRAISKRFKLAKHHAASSLWIESDSLFTVQIILDKVNPPWKSQFLLREIHKNHHSFAEWHISHCWRGRNALADFLSKF
ncbi:uncharacterized protein LOC143891738 [Tasmannia lanceolata]|uniref:uncharacterized protein LOC143891738 n=1 Tax=Tasmannia lanceolata TaxID=3420 RepID=UPI0040641427